jgi:hypothetical protein
MYLNTQVHTKHIKKTCVTPNLLPLFRSLVAKVEIDEQEQECLQGRVGVVLKKYVKDGFASAVFSRKICSHVSSSSSSTFILFTPRALLGRNRLTV